jgi:hypothetical protein
MSTLVLLCYSIFVISDTIVEYGIDYLHRNYEILSPEARVYYHHLIGDE